MSNCKVCSIEVTDPILKHTYFDPRFPDIDIGPFCEACLAKIRICSGCRKPKVYDTEITYLGNGQHYCRQCQDSIEVCSSCSIPVHDCVEHRGRKYCRQCFDKKFRHCECCDTVKSKDLFIVGPLEIAQRPTLFKGKPICSTCFDREAQNHKVVPIEHCARCRNLFPKENPKQRYCSGCIDRIPTCEHCGEKDHNGLWRTGDITFIDDPKVGDTGKEVYFCRQCSHHFKECRCGKISKRPKTLKGTFTKTIQCQTCANNDDLVECKTCLRFVKKSLLKEENLCNNCYIRYHDKCPTCGFSKGDANDCRKCNPDNHRLVSNYSHKPHPKFSYTEKDEIEKETLFFGIENEVTFGYNDNSEENRRKYIRNIFNCYGPDVVCTKSDASIRGIGVEVVTQPMTLEVFKKMDLSPFFSRYMEDSSSCGMHVHVSRGAFISDLHIFKVVEFIHNHQNFVDHVVGRSTNGYNRGLEKKPSETIKDSKRGAASRRARVNLASKPTIEFRMFQGCTREYEMRYRVEFLHALIKWTMGASIKDLDSDSLIAYVEKGGDLYSNLVKFLEITWRN